MTKSGEKVTTADEWWKVRRPEIVEDFDREIYGRVPAVTPKVTWEVTETTNETKFDIPVVTKKLVGHVDNSACPAITVDIQLTLTTPADAKGPVPVVMELSFGFRGGRCRRSADRRGAPPDAYCRTGTQPGSSKCLEKGLGLRELLSRTAFRRITAPASRKESSGSANKGQPRAVDDWGALRAGLGA